MTDQIRIEIQDDQLRRALARAIAAAVDLTPKTLGTEIIDQDLTGQSISGWISADASTVQR